jgi:CheY-like chemotaxis protein
MSVLAAGARSSVPDILVVDDDSRNLLAIESLLQPIAAHIVCARSGEEALKQVLQHDFAVIVIDVGAAARLGRPRIPLLPLAELAGLLRRRQLLRRRAQRAHLVEGPRRHGQLQGGVRARLRGDPLRRARQRAALARQAPRRRALGLRAGAFVEAPSPRRRSRRR